MQSNDTFWCPKCQNYKQTLYSELTFKASKGIGKAKHWQCITCYTSLKSEFEYLSEAKIYGKEVKKDAHRLS